MKCLRDPDEVLGPSIPATMSRRSHFAVLALLCASADAFAVAPPRPLTPTTQLLQPTRHSICRHDQPRMQDYSTKVKITAETRAPLRQARIFFVYPATIAGASIAAYVSVLRAIGGKGEGLSDIFNLGINGAIVAGAVFLLTRDLSGRAETLKEVAIELGEMADPNASSGEAEE